MQETLDELIATAGTNSQIMVVDSAVIERLNVIIILLATIAIILALHSVFVKDRFSK
jgi:hypothetical protein